jgi:hypothetical protein
MAVYNMLCNLVKEGNLPSDDDFDEPNNGPNGGSNKPPDPKDDKDDDIGGYNLFSNDENAKCQDFEDDFKYYPQDSNQFDDDQSQDDTDNSWTNVAQYYSPIFLRHDYNPFINGQLLSSNYIYNNQLINPFKNFIDIPCNNDEMND